MFFRPVLLFGTVIALIMLLLLVDWRFVWRALTYPKAPIMAADWYRPRVPVPGRADTPLAIAPPSTPEFAAALDEVVAYAAARNSTGLIILYRNQIVREEYWQGYDETSVFNAMSMSKTIVGLLVGVAIAEGHIPSLDVPAANYLPEWRQDSRQTITLRDLIYMQSGLRNERNTTRPTSDLVQLYIGSDIVKTTLNIPTVRPPGEVFDYNNVNSQVLAIVLERATGMKYEDYLSTRLWQPLSATDGSVWRDRPNGMAKTFCCLFATAQDWARVGQLFLHEGRVGNTAIVSAEWIRQMQVPSPLEATFGKHIWLKARTPEHPNVDQAATQPFLAEDTLYLDGRDLQRVYIIPSRQLVIVRMGELPETWDDAVIPNRLVRGLDAIEPR
jgi:CubicO group peptidase (beta-lactamase class C family)